MKTRILLLVSLLTISAGMAQTADKPWRIGVAANAIDIFPVGGSQSSLFPVGSQGDLFEEFTNVKENWSIGGPTISLERYLKGSLSLGAMVSFNNVTNYKNNTTNTDYPYISADAYLKFSPLASKGFSPYLIGGYGISSFQFSNPTDLTPILLSQNASKQYFGGFGLDFRLTPTMSLSLQSNYKVAYELYGTRHFQHQGGINYSFGSGDRDKDGISDKKDKCPDVPGLKEFEGCPDTDEDGIPDNEDDCPEEAGKKELKGCPDSDGDGVSDKDDLCPEVAGPVEMQGCPDTDKDGVHDGVDECPEEVGLESNNGCPLADTDGDGVPDQDDLCPELAGTPEKNGCPNTLEEIVSTANAYGNMINFMAGSDKILGKKMLDILEKIKTLLDENPQGVFLVEGFASNDGDEALNQALSIKRAESVRKSLVNMGVSPDRLEVMGYGEAKPLESNDTEEGRSKNRRVQFRLKTN